MFEYLQALSFIVYSFHDKAVDQLQVSGDSLCQEYYAVLYLKDSGINPLYLYNLEALGSIPLFALSPLLF